MDNNRNKTINSTNSSSGKFKRELILAILSILFSTIFAISLASIINLPISYWSIAIFTILLSVILSLAFYNYKTSIVTMVVLVVLGLSLFIPKVREILYKLLDNFDISWPVIKELYGDFIEQGAQFFKVNLNTIDAHNYALIGYIILLVNALLSYIFIQKLANYWYAWLISIIALILGISSANKFASFMTIPLILIAIFLTLLGSGNTLSFLRFKFGSKQLLKASLELLAIALVDVLISGALANTINYNSIYSPYLQGIVDDLTTLLPSSLQPKLNVATYSISQDGFYPNGNKLGGRVELKDNNIAKIRGKAPKLMKTQSSDFYNGLGWYKTVNNPNYRFNSPFNGDSEFEIFNEKVDQDQLSKIPGINAERVYKDFAYSLQPLVKGTQILFNSGTPTKISASREEAQLFYFNQAGNIYAKNPFDNQHEYDLESYAIDSEAIGFSEKDPDYEKLKSMDEFVEASKAEDRQLKNHNNAFDNYLQIPESELYQAGGDIYETAMEITRDIQGEYSKIQAILTYFKNNEDFTYTLEVSDPPENQDFLQHFLQTKEGYCTYYATAMTIFARLNGIPARYVEGYSLSPENLAELKSGKTSDISSKRAHAWTEVYLNGLGWIPLNPTPGVGDEPDNSMDDPEEEIEETPEPSTEQTTTTTTTAEQNQETTPSSSEPTSPTTSSDNENEEPENKNNLFKAFLVIAIIILVLLIIIVAIYIYYRYRKNVITKIHDRDYLRKEMPDNSRRARFYWKELLSLQKLLQNLEAKGFMTERDLASITDSESINWLAIAEIVAEARYSKQQLSEQKVEYLADSFDQLEKFVIEDLDKASYLFKRILDPRQGRY